MLMMTVKLMKMMKLSMSTLIPLHLLLLTLLPSCWDDYSEEDQATLQPFLRYWTV